jgi:gamma-glutamyltranspeptidase/glutathione hydrolase
VTVGIRTSPGGGESQRGAAASDPRAAQAARAALAHGNAADAVAAGVLVAAAYAPGVLLGPLQVLVGGAGAGLLAIDGRVKQPGRGAPRPRGFLDDEPVPDAARVGAPGLPAALATLVATAGAGNLARAAAAAIQAAKTLSPERAQLIDVFSRRGPPALEEDGIAGELIAAAGRPARGLLTRDDLGATRPAVVRCSEDTLVSGVLLAPWRDDPRLEATLCHVVAALDGKGLAAIACYEVPAEGVAVPALGLVAPLSADPVLRGKPRVRPGAPRPAAAPVALRMIEGVVADCVAVTGAADGERALDAMLGVIVEGTSAVKALGAVEGAVGVARVGNGVRVVGG